MRHTLIHNALIINEGRSLHGSVLITDGRIAEVIPQGETRPLPDCDAIDAGGCCLLPGVIDDHVHFRDPGLTQKADILTESRAAAAGGVTSIMDMPNCKPATTTLDALEAKQELLNEKCIVNHSCYYGATNDNYRDFPKLDRHRVCGIKLFMGSSTGNMLVDNTDSLRRIFEGTDLLIAAHCEDQHIISRNIEQYLTAHPGADDAPVELHADIRSAEACLSSSQAAVRLAKDSGARLHILHVSTAAELPLFTEALPVEQKRITAEACVAHLLYTRDSYQRLGTRIKCNPSVKETSDREALRAAVNSGRIDVIATDHAPHLLSDKEGGALKAASGMPMIQFSLPAMLDLADRGVFTIETLVEKMCHAPARIYRIEKRGFIRPGYMADLVLVRPRSPWTLTKDMIQSKCGWSPLEGHRFGWKVEKTFVNGRLVYEDGQVNDSFRGEELRFNP